MSANVNTRPMKLRSKAFFMVVCCLNWYEVDQDGELQLTGEGMQAGLPKTISDHKKQVDQRGSTIHLRETIDNILCIIDNAESRTLIGVVIDSPV